MGLLGKIMLMDTWAYVGYNLLQQLIKHVSYYCLLVDRVRVASGLCLSGPDPSAKDSDPSISL